MVTTLCFLLYAPVFSLSHVCTSNPSCLAFFFACCCLCSFHICVSAYRQEIHRLHQLNAAQTATLMSNGMSHADAVAEEAERKRREEEEQARKKREEEEEKKKKEEEEEKKRQAHSRTPSMNNKPLVSLSRFFSHNHPLLAMNREKEKEKEAPLLLLPSASLGSSVQAEIALEMKLVHDAYGVLKDTIRRVQYEFLLGQLIMQQGKHSLGIQTHRWLFKIICHSYTR